MFRLKRSLTFSKPALCFVIVLFALVSKAQINAQPGDPYFGEVAIGSSKTLGASDGIFVRLQCGAPAGQFCPPSKFLSVSMYRGIDFRIVEDKCTGVVTPPLANGEYFDCGVSVEFTPTIVEYQEDGVDFEIDNGVGTLTAVASVSGRGIWTSATPTPTPAPTPNPTPTPTPSPTPSNFPKPTDLFAPLWQAITSKFAPVCAAGSIIHVDNRSVGESVDVVGAPFSLYYFSDRVIGRKDNNTIKIPLTGTNVSGLGGVVMNIQYGSRTVNEFYPPLPNQSYDFVWDGKDENGNLVEGSIPVQIAIVYLNADGSSPYAIYPLTVGGYQAAATGLGAWTPSNHHFYDTQLKRINYGNGISLPVDPIAYKGNLLVVSNSGDEAYIFDASGRHLETRNAITNALIMTFGYDLNGLLISETDSFGNKTVINHNGAVPTSIVSPYGQTTLLSVDQNGYLSRIANPAGNAYAISYSANGLLTSFTKPNGHTSLMTYDAGGKLLKDQGAAGDSSTFAESTENGIKTIQKLTSLNRETLYTSSDDGTNLNRATRLPTGETSSTLESTYSSQSTSLQSLITQATNVDDERFGSMSPVTSAVQSSIANTSYASRSNITQTVATRNGDVLDVDQLLVSTMIDSDSRKTFVSKYDGNLRTSSSVTPEGQISKTIYGQSGQVISTQQGQLTPSSFSYDQRGRLSGITQGSRKSLLTYDAFGNVGMIQNALGLKTSMKYDNAGRLSEEIRPDGKSLKYSYDAAGNLASLTPANNFVHQFSVNLSEDPAGYLPPKVGGISTGATLYSYNLDRQVTQVSMPNGTSLIYSYEPASGRLVSVAGSKGSLALSYNSVTKQLSSIQTNDGVATGYEFVGPLKTKEVTISALGSQVVNLDYETNMSLSSLSLSSRAGLERAVSISYDRDGRPIQIGDEKFAIDAQSGLLKTSSVGVVSQNLNYNSFGEQTVDTYKAGSKQIYSAEMVRNALGQITQRTENVNGKKVRFDYAYDNLSRLTSVKTNGLKILSYSYDANGNRVGTSELLGLIKIKEKYDEQDRLISNGEVTYSYDQMGNRMKKSVPVGKKKSDDTLYSYNSFGQLTSVTLPNGKQIEYLIDGLGRRIGKRVNGKLVQGFIYQSQTQVAAETDGNGVVVKRFVYGQKPNVPDYMITKDGTFRLITDQVGTLRMIVDVSNGKIVDESISTAFGEITLDLKRFSIPFGFAGGLYDRDTGLVHFGAREYDPQVGRWISKDPIEFKGGDTNLYGYLLNDPVNLIDPSGLVGIVVNGGHATGASSSPGTCGDGNSNEAGGGIYLGTENGSLVGGATTTAGVGHSSTGIAAGVGVGVTIVFGNMSSTVGPGVNQNIVVGPASMTFSYDSSGKLVSIGVGLGGHGMGLGQFFNNVTTTLTPFF